MEYPWPADTKKDEDGILARDNNVLTGNMKFPGFRLAKLERTGFVTKLERAVHRMPQAERRRWNQLQEMVHRSPPLGKRNQLHAIRPLAEDLGFDSRESEGSFPAHAG